MSMKDVNVKLSLVVRVPPDYKDDNRVARNVSATIGHALAGRRIAIGHGQSAIVRDVRIEKEEHDAADQ